MPRKPENIYDTCITVRVKRRDQTFFILCDEYETVMTLAGRMLNVLDQMQFQFKDQEVPFEPKDVQFFIEKRALDNDSTLHDQQVFNDTEVYCCLR